MSNQPTHEHDHVLTITCDSRGGGRYIYHTPDPEDPTQPDCQWGDRGTNYRPRDPEQLADDDKPWSLCSFCRGEYTVDPDVASESRKRHERYAALEPEDLGLEPLPDGGQA